MLGPHMVVGGGGQAMPNSAQTNRLVYYYLAFLSRPVTQSLLTYVCNFKKLFNKFI
jgi:hypothetical protein